MNFSTLLPCLTTSIVGLGYKSTSAGICSTTGRWDAMDWDWSSSRGISVCCTHSNWSGVCFGGNAGRCCPTTHCHAGDTRPSVAPSLAAGSPAASVASGPTACSPAASSSPAAGSLAGGIGRVFAAAAFFLFDDSALWANGMPSWPRLYPLILKSPAMPLVVAGSLSAWRAWMLEWVLSDDFWVNRRRHSLHPNSFSPVWVRRCRSSLYFVGRVLEQNLQMCVWVRRCRSSLYFVCRVLEQILQMCLVIAVGRSCLFTTPTGKHTVIPDVQRRPGNRSILPRPSRGRHGLMDAGGGR